MRPLFVFLTPLYQPGKTTATQEPGHICRRQNSAKIAGGARLRAGRLSQNPKCESGSQRRLSQNPRCESGLRAFLSQIPRLILQEILSRPRNLNFSQPIHYLFPDNPPNLRCLKPPLKEKHRQSFSYPRFFILSQVHPK